MGLRIIPHSLTDGAVLTSTPAPVAGLGADNLKLSDRGLVYRVLGDAVDLHADLPAAARVGGILIHRHSLSTAATWRVRIYSDVGLTGALQYDSGFVQAVPAKSLGDLDWGVDPLGAAIGQVDYSYLVIEPRDVVARSIRIEVSDPGTSLIQIGRLFVGPVIRPQFGFAWGLSLAWERETKRTRTAAGGLRVEASAPWRKLKLDLEWITDTGRTAFAELLRDTGSGGEIWLSARTGDGGQLEADNAILGVLTTDQPLVRQPGQRYTHTIEIEEA